MKTVIFIFLIFAAAGAAFWYVPGPTWEHMASPGRLSSSHANLENNCSACHTSFKGVDPLKCTACHASNQNLLKRQPTAFHAHVTSCGECHIEHRGIDKRPTEMDHSALAIIGLRQLKDKKEDAQAVQTAQFLAELAKKGNGGLDPIRFNPRLSPKEAALNCFTCHGNQDRHGTLFGMDCAACHTTDRWNIPEFRHPSANSMDCNQCHRGPPSHYMMHFQMVSVTVAGKPHARVEQCFLCHQTTSWNDIKGVGFYKHH